MLNAFASLKCSKNASIMYKSGKSLPKEKMLTTLGVRSFSDAVLKIWNGLPVELHQATKQRNLTVLNLDLKLIFLGLTFIIFNFVLFFAVM